MKALQMVVPRLEMMARLAADRELARDPVRVAQLREDYRYVASVCRSLVPGLEDEIWDLPPSVPERSSIEVQVAFQMGLIRRTNRLHRAVSAHLARTASGRRRAARST